MSKILQQDYQEYSKLIEEGHSQRSACLILGLHRSTIQRYIKGVLEDEVSEDGEKYLHPAFIKKLQVQFNKLNEKQKQNVLSYFSEENGCNAAQRKLYFKKFVLKRNHSMNEILEVIHKEKQIE